MLVGRLIDNLTFTCLNHPLRWKHRFYLTAARADEEIEDRTKYLARLSLFDPQCLRFWPSTAAAGLVILSSLASNRDSSCQHVMEVRKINCLKLYAWPLLIKPW